MFEFWPIAVLIVLVVVGVLLVVWADRLRKRASDTNDDSLDYYREMFKQGMLTEAEFERIERHFADPTNPSNLLPPASKHPPQSEDSFEEK